MDDKIKELKKIIDESNNIVFFGGAGVSTESGIPDFRSANGIYNMNLGRTVSPEEMISHSFYMRHTEDFYEFYKEIGLNINIVTVPFDRLMEIATNQEHDLMSVEYTYAPVDAYTDVVWLLGGEESWTAYSSEAVDTAMALSQTLDDEKEIAQQYLVVDRAMQEDVAMISGWVIATLGAVNNRLTGVTPNVFGTFIDVQNWDVK